MSASLRPLKGLFLIRIINPVTFPLGIKPGGNDLNLLRYPRGKTARF